MLLLDFSHIRQYLSDIGDTIRIAIVDRDVDIGAVMRFELAPVQPTISSGNLSPALTGLFSPGVCLLCPIAIKPEDYVSMVMMILCPFDNPKEPYHHLQLHHAIH